MRDVTLCNIIAFLFGLASLLLALVYLGSSSSQYVRWIVVTGAGAVIFGAVNLYLVLAQQKEIEKRTKLAEDLFIRTFGKKADKVEPILREICTLGPLAQILSDKTMRAKFRSGKKVYKGTVDVKNEVLHIEEPELVPVYADESIPLWKEVSKLHKNGTPKKVEYYDGNEFPLGEEYFDENGGLKKGSWRRYKGREEYWNPEKQEWEPI